MIVGINTLVLLGPSIHVSGTGKLFRHKHKKNDLLSLEPYEKGMTKRAISIPLAFEVRKAWWTFYVFLIRCRHASWSRSDILMWTTQNTACSSTVTEYLYQNENCFCSHFIWNTNVESTLEKSLSVHTVTLVTQFLKWCLHLYRDKLKHVCYLKTT